MILLYIVRKIQGFDKLIEGLNLGELPGHWMVDDQGLYGKTFW